MVRRRGNGLLSGGGAAVNLGNDTDTSGCVTGGLAGLYYGADTIPAGWLDVLAGRDDIEDLAIRLAGKYGR